MYATIKGVKDADVMGLKPGRYTLTVTTKTGAYTKSGIGNILNSVGKACGEAGHETECKKTSGGKIYYGKSNTNQGILQLLAENNIPSEDAIGMEGVQEDSVITAPVERCWIHNNYFFVIINNSHP